MIRSGREQIVIVQVLVLLIYVKTGLAYGPPVQTKTATSSELLPYP
jgi:hypothetical protein